MIKRLIVLLLVLGLLFGGIFGWKYYQKQQQATQPPPPPAVVAAAQVRSETWQPSLQAVGSLAAIQGVYVTNEVAGLVEKINLKSGQHVEAGELLLQLRDSVAQAELRGLQAQERLAELQFERNARLLKQKSISRSVYDEARARLKNARAQVASKRAAIQKKYIRAPFSGQLGIKQVDLGQYLDSGSPIVLLQALDPIHLNYSLPERYFSMISPGQKVTATVQAYPNQTFVGRITAISPGITPATRSIQVQATLDNPKHRLRPGMFAEVRTLLPGRNRILTLPRTAITYNPYGDMVFAVKEEKGGLVVQQQMVETGEVRHGRVEIIEGLQLGERVVSVGQVKLQNGQRIEISHTDVLHE